jgi:hypothetical protein
MPDFSRADNSQSGVTGSQFAEKATPKVTLRPQRLKPNLFYGLLQLG